MYSLGSRDPAANLTWLISGPKVGLTVGWSSNSPYCQERPGQAFPASLPEREPVLDSGPGASSGSRRRWLLQQGGLPPGQVGIWVPGEADLRCWSCDSYSAGPLNTYADTEKLLQPLCRRQKGGLLLLRSLCLPWPLARVTDGGRIFSFVTVIQVAMSWWWPRASRDLGLYFYYLFIYSWLLWVSFAHTSFL